MTTHQFSPQQRAALEAVGFTDSPLMPWHPRMVLVEFEFEFIAVPDFYNRDIVLVAQWGGKKITMDYKHVTAEAEIRAFVARFVPTLEPIQV